jgi:cytochrome oxidase Cu insertion factor (SCO1/SenC/PrrC family)
MRFSGCLWVAFVLVAFGCGVRRAVPVVTEAPQRVEIAVGSKIGNRAPSFALPDSNGQTVALDSYRGRPTVLVFYRGQW